MASVKLIKTVMEYFGLSDPPEKSEAMNYILMTREVVSYLFRVFDSNCNGNIESQELVPILTGWLIACLNLGTDLLIIVEDLLISAQVQQLVGELGPCVEGVAVSSDTVVTIDDAAQKILALASDAFALLQTYIIDISSSLDLPPAGFLAELFRSQNAVSLIQSVRRHAESGNLSDVSVVQCVDEVAPLLITLVENCLSSEMISCTVDEAVQWLEKKLIKYRGNQAVSVPRELVEAAVGSIADSLRNIVRQDVSRQLVKTALDFVDVDGDGMLSKCELGNLADNISQLAKVCVTLTLMIVLSHCWISP